jgi:hypothetical protein
MKNTEFTMSGTNNQGLQNVLIEKPLNNEVKHVNGNYADPDEDEEEEEEDLILGDEDELEGDEEEFEVELEEDIDPAIDGKDIDDADDLIIDPDDDPDEDDEDDDL